MSSDSDEDIDLPTGFGITWEGRHYQRPIRLNQQVAPEQLNRQRPYLYYQNLASPNRPSRELCVLLSELDLNPTWQGRSGVRFPLRRLVCAGLDTQRNLDLLFGNGARFEFRFNQDHWDIRMEYFVGAEEGSMCYINHQRLDHRYFTSPVGRDAREPSQGETEAIREIRLLRSALHHVTRPGNPVLQQHINSIMTARYGTARHELEFHAALMEMAIWTFNQGLTDWARDWSY